MVAYSFKAQFASSVESGKKIQTIRADRKNGHASAGDRLQLYTGMRTKDCRKLRPDPLCLSVEPIRIALSTTTGLTTVIMGGQHLNAYQALAVAQADGFDSVEAMGKFFEDTHGLPFEGFLIKWESLWGTEVLLDGTSKSLSSDDWLNMITVGGDGRLSDSQNKAIAFLGTCSARQQAQMMDGHKFRIETNE